MGCDIKKAERPESSSTVASYSGEISLKKFNLNSVIGRGGFGKVHPMGFRSGELKTRRQRRSTP